MDAYDNGAPSHEVVLRGLQESVHEEELEDGVAEVEELGAHEHHRHVRTRVRQVHATVKAKLCSTSQVKE